MPKKDDKKRERKKKKRGVTMSQKKERWDDTRERTNALRSKPYPSIHPFIHLHLLIEIA